MKKLAWATDVHLDFLRGDTERMVEFATSLIPQDAGEVAGIVLTGDIAIAKDVTYCLSAIERVVQRPVYFVLGNHDYYGAGIDDVRKAMKELTNVSQFLRYMPTAPYQALTPATALVGHDGWYDGLYGDWQTSTFMMNDWVSIADFFHYGRSVFAGNKPDRANIVGIARKLAHEAVTHVHDGIKQAVRYHKNVICMTHFPPFKESHVYRGQIGDDNAQPWYTSKMMGDLLLQASTAYPDVKFTVLCGHTHGKVTFQARPNLIVHTGGAEYDQPKLQGLIEAP